MEKLKRETHAYFKNEKETEHTYAFNLYLHDSPMGLDGYSEEENKIREEVRKILQDDEISLSATCVRVPVLRAHSLFANIECKTKISLREAQEAITHMSGVTYLKKNATPLHASGKNEIFCSRIRIDPSRPNTIEFWAVGDQLLKGAALNCVQIAEKLDGLAK